ncbi:exosome complex component Rrp43p [Monosporozyma unispora]|nr:hypothetical protein C6P44_000872 [Kazachstania unispora]
MTDIVEDTIDIHPVSFAPEVLARISPELSLQRHLSLGFRPSLKGFEEFREVELNEDHLSRYGVEHKDNSIIGSNVLKCGKTFVVTTITGGIIEDSTIYKNEENELISLDDTKKTDLTNYTSVFPVVEVERGRAGACTDEEMTLSQKIYDSMLHSKLLPKSSLKIEPGIRITDDDGTMEIIYSDESKQHSAEENSFKTNRKWSYLLYAKIKVFSRTGPVFDLCWNSLMYALQSVKLPRAFIDERATDLKMTIRTRGRSATVKETYDILSDSSKQYPLNLNKENIAFASNYGTITLDSEAKLTEEADEEDIDMDAVETILLADLDTESEETSVNTTLSIISNDKGDLKHVSILGGDANISPDNLRKSILLAQQRAKDLKDKL